jgi:hypothetical protein
MPAKSEKQRRFMAMAYNDPDMGVPKEVAKKYMKKPAKGFKEGGKLPDRTGDGKVTQADVLKGRGVFTRGGAAQSAQAGGMASSRRPSRCARKIREMQDTFAPRRGNASAPSSRRHGRWTMIGGHG